jgi:hypothetical protein
LLLIMLGNRMSTLMAIAGLSRRGLKNCAAQVQSITSMAGIAQLDHKPIAPRTQ